MASPYPTAYPAASYTTHLNAREDIAAIATELGLDPSGTYATVTARLAAFATVVNNFDPANAVTTGFVPIGTGTALVTRALLSTDNPAVVINTQTASYTLVAADAGKLVEMNVGTANNWTVPSGIFSAGHIVAGRQYGIGTTTIVQGSGLNLRSRGNLVASAGQYAEWTVTFRSATEAVLSGDLA